MKKEVFFNQFSAFMKDGNHRNLESFLDNKENSYLLDIYRNGFFKSSIESLKSNFPTVLSLVGEEFFDNIAAKFVSEAPPSNVALMNYGENFIDYLLNSLKDLDYIHEFAKLDWHWLQCLNGSDDQAMDVEQFQQLIAQHDEIDSLPIGLISSMIPLTLNYPILDLWRQLKQATISEQQELYPKQQFIMLWKISGQVQGKALTDSEWTFMQKFYESQSLSVAAEAAFSENPEFDMSQIFSQLLENQLLKQV